MHSASSGMNLLEALREATSQAHRSLEQRPAMRRLLSSELTRSQYSETLMLFARFYHYMDAQFALPESTSQLPPGYLYRARLPWLISDLKQLHASPFKPAAWLPSSLPTILKKEQRAPALLGFAYVIEGSAQGAKIIAPKISKQLELNKSNGLAFFSQQTEGSANWLTLRQHLIATPAAVGSDHQTQLTDFAKQVCQAANHAFEYLQQLCESSAPGYHLNGADEGVKTA